MAEVNIDICDVATAAGVVGGMIEGGKRALELAGLASALGGPWSKLIIGGLGALAGGILGGLAARAACEAFKKGMKGGPEPTGPPVG